MRGVAVVAAAFSVACVASAQTLLKDINTTPPPNPSTPALAIPWQAAAGWLFFPADDGRYGRELWRSDGTASGTQMVKDVILGAGGSAPDRLAVLGNLLLYMANTPETGEELWRSDGTAAGTFLLLDLQPGVTGSSPAPLGVAGGRLYFAATDQVAGTELWVTDGTAAGTSLVVDLRPGAAGSSPHGGAVVGNTLYFAADDGTTGVELWAVTGATIRLVRDINTSTPGAASNPQHLRALGAKLVFTADDGVVAEEPWVSDGTTAGTVLLQDVAPFLATSSRPANLTVVGTSLYFSANDGAHGFELWLTDGTPAGTHLVTDLSPGGANSDPGSLVAVGTKLFFAAQTPATGRELFASDGTAAGTMLIADLNPGSTSTVFSEMGVLGLRLAFRFSDPVHGVEVWSTDGTAAGTALLKDINATAPYVGSAPSHFTAWNGRLYFMADDGLVGRELWGSDLTAAGTLLVADLSLPHPSSADPTFLMAFAQQVLFSANDGIAGAELWISDGTAAGTRMLADLNPGSASSSPRALAVCAGKAYFSALVTTLGNDTGRELWVTDGTPAGTSLLKDINPGRASGAPEFAVVFREQIYFTAYDASHGQELWRSDGTAAGTTLVKDFDPAGNGLATAANVICVRGDQLIVVADDGVHGQELWTSDGTSAGTTLLLDLHPGSEDGVRIVSTQPALSIVAGDTYFFCGTEGTQGYELWKSDGTAAGTVLVKDIQPGSGAALPAHFGAFADKVCFQANDGVHGVEPWVSDGTAAGTFQLADISTGPASSEPMRFAGASDRCGFLANDRTIGRATGYEPWITDGTTAGTHLVLDLDPGPASSCTGDGFGVAGVGPRLALVATDGVHGFEHWISDGAAAGTRMVAEVRPGALSGAAGSWIFAGDLWFVTGDDGASGREPFVFPAKATGAANVETFGAGCAGSGGRVPAIAANSAPVLGNQGFALRLAGARATSPAVLFVSGGSGFLALDACTFYLALPAPTVVLTTDAAGAAVAALPLAANPSWLGRSAWMQWVVVDPNGGYQGLVSLSMGMRLVFGLR